MSRTAIVWLCLVLATLLSFLLADRAGIGSSSARTAVLAVALVKARYVGLEFMELRTSPVAFRIAYEVWALVTAGTLIALFAT